MPPEPGFVLDEPPDPGVAPTPRPPVVPFDPPDAVPVEPRPPVPWLLPAPVEGPELPPELSPTLSARPTSPVQPDERAKPLNAPSDERRAETVRAHSLRGGDVRVREVGAHFMRSLSSHDALTMRRRRQRQLEGQGDVSRHPRVQTPSRCAKGSQAHPHRGLRPRSRGANESSYRRRISRRQGFLARFVRKSALARFLFVLVHLAWPIRTFFRGDSPQFWGVDPQWWGAGTPPDDQRPPHGLPPVTRETHLCVSGLRGCAAGIDRNRSRRHDRTGSAAERTRSHEQEALPGAKGQPVSRPSSRLDVSNRSAMGRKRPPRRTRRHEVVNRKRFVAPLTTAAKRPWRPAPRARAACPPLRPWSRAC